MALSLATAAAADFQKTYDNAANRRITVVTLHGDIKLSGYDGKDIDISAVKKGPDSGLVEIEDAGFGNHIYKFQRYLEHGRCNAAVDFEIRVPKELFYDAAAPDAKPQVVRGLKPAFPKFPAGTPIPSAPHAPQYPRGEGASYAIYLKSNSGQITISDVAGSIRAETGGRIIEVRDVEGRLSVSSVSGDIKGLLKQASRHSVMQFSSISGNISVQAPDDISTQVYIRSESGQVKTDFSLETKEMRYGPGKFIQGKLGGGSQELDIRSLLGAINFHKKPSEK
jgi:hypothetical protein